MSGLRVLRVLRPLRSLKSSPRLSALVVSMLKSLPQLGSVIILLTFIFLVFGILGVQLFSGLQVMQALETRHVWRTRSRGLDRSQVTMIGLSVLCDDWSLCDHFSSARSTRAAARRRSP
jgi:hypothetical protein